MSEDRFEQDVPKDEDVEAHRKTRLGTDEGSDTSDDVVFATSAPGRALAFLRMHMAAE